jgi:hypothetical protein
VKVNSPSDSTDNVAVHERIVSEVAGYGGHDHGFVPLTVSTRIRGR